MILVLALQLSLQLSLRQSPLLCLSVSVNTDKVNYSFHKIVYEQCYAISVIITIYNICFQKYHGHFLNHLNRKNDNNWTETEYIGIEKSTSFRGQKEQIWVSTGCSTGCLKLSSLEGSFHLLLTPQLFKVSFVLNHSSIATRQPLYWKYFSTLADKLIFRLCLSSDWHIYAFYIN